MKKDILDLLQNDHLRLTPTDLERMICEKYPLATRRSVRQTVRALLADGSLVYTQRFSTTHLEINYNRTFRVSDRIVLSPPNRSADLGPNDIGIKLNDGTSFGKGDHPTTRLSLQAMDFVFRKCGEAKSDKIYSALDIGTGSGVLAIAAAKLGAKRVEGVDIDPAACHEAIANTKLNGLSPCRVNISTVSIERFVHQPFDLIIANLRPPTLRELLPHMVSVSTTNVIWIISGCREEEKHRLLQRLPSNMSHMLWRATLTDWAAFAVKG